MLECSVQESFIEQVKCMGFVPKVKIVDPLTATITCPVVVTSTVIKVLVFRGNVVCVKQTIGPQEAVSGDFLVTLGRKKLNTPLLDSNISSQGGAPKTPSRMPWTASKDTVLWPGRTHAVLFQFEGQQSNEIVQTYVTNFEMPPSIPPLIMIKDACIVEKWENIQNWQEHCIELHFKMPQHFGGSDVLEWRVAAYVKDGFTDEWKHCGSSADVALHADQVNALLKVTPLPKWLGQECTFQILMRNEYGWNAAEVSVPTTYAQKLLQIPSDTDVRVLDTKDLKRLQSRMVGNVFGANPESFMLSMGLLPQSRPFLLTTMTILTYALQKNLRSAQHLVDMDEKVKKKAAEKAAEAKKARLEMFSITPDSMKITKLKLSGRRIGGTLRIMSTNMLNS
jgi:hypothetical protein